MPTQIKWVGFEKNKAMSPVRLRLAIIKFINHLWDGGQSKGEKGADKGEKGRQKGEERQRRESKMYIKKK